VYAFGRHHADIVFPGKWKVIYFYPKDFTSSARPRSWAFARLAAEFEERDAVLLAGSADNEFVKLGWRRDHKDLDRLNHWMFADVTGSLIDSSLVQRRAGRRCVVSVAARLRGCTGTNSFGCKPVQDPQHFLGLRPTFRLLTESAGLVSGVDDERPPDNARRLRVADAEAAISDPVTSANIQWFRRSRSLLIAPPSQFHELVCPRCRRAAPHRAPRTRRKPGKSPRSRSGRRT